MRNILITHANCMDGFGVALAVKYHDILTGITDREIHYCNYGDPAPEVVGANVIIGDFSFSRDELIDLHSQANSLVVLDHHKTAKENLEGLDFCIFDMSKSGAVLTWEYLFPDEIVPGLLRYIQDRDLWNWSLKNSKEISSYLQTVDFKNIELNKVALVDWLYMINDKEMIANGAAILAYQNQHIKKISNKKEKLPRTNIGGFDVICINATTLISETGNALAADEPFVAMYFDTEDKRVFSLRSHDDGEDVSVIAKKYGGGGHPRAAGFSVTKPDPLYTINPIGTFGWAIDAMQRGGNVCRRGWNGKGMSIYYADNESAEFLPFIAMKTVDDKFVPWLASQTDMLADDWEVA